MSTQTLNDTECLPLRRANDYLGEAKRTFAPQMLFDEFWREGELALLFGPPASGKSILALQLADALARGTGFYGFRMPEWRRRVLYVDLRNTNEQFAERCSIHAVGKFPGRAHKFPRGLFRDRPPAGVDLCEWLRSFTRQHEPEVVIIDDLTAVKNTHDGTRETLRILRRLREIRDELGISILVLTDSNESHPRRTINETDLGRSRILCTVADSVFAADRSLKKTDDHYLVQIRARAAVPFWTAVNAPTAKVIRRGTGLLEFEFDERFSPAMDPYMRALICTVVHMQEQEGKTFREIAAELEISKSWACKLYGRWTPAMERGLDEILDEWREDDEFEYEEEQEQVAAAGPTHFAAAEGMDLSHNGPPYPIGSDGVEVIEPSGYPPYEVAVPTPSVGTDGVVLSQGGIQQVITGAAENNPAAEASAPLLRKEGSFVGHRAPCLVPWRRDGSYSSIPFLAALRRRSVYDLELSYDGYGREIWVEKWEHHSGKPQIWYNFDNNGCKVRSVRNSIGVSRTHLTSGPYL
ncbi:MAG: AAA family ATPase [Pyrinomonadaceae bacterium]|nr:AAA family ATPase [Pyrinomonadaceae bacterium]